MTKILKLKLSKFSDNLWNRDFLVIFTSLYYVLIIYKVCELLCSAWFKKSADCSKIKKKNNKKIMTYRMIDCHTGQKHYTHVTCCVGYDNVFSPDIVAWGMIKILGEKTLTLQFDILFT